ncbi:hypothetical protein REC_169 [Pseudomonas phage REC]|nr:hypothetical protein REC_169 [Pseudomonas phage REC]UGL62573.1 hypothetical protein [Pseudomonas phage REC1]
MTTDQKARYIESFMKLIVNAETYRDACAHSNFVRGILAAWNADLTITLDMFKQYNHDIELVMEVKRKLPVKGDVL